MPGFWGPYPHALVDGLWMVKGGQVSAESVLTWLSRQIFGLDDAGTQALIAEAGRRPAGRNGLLTLDYFMGNRTPYRDPHLRGAVLGLSLGHDRAALHRSAVQGVALASANIPAQAQGLGVPIGRIVSAGGFAKNALWLQTTVDAIGLPVRLAAEENLSIVGPRRRGRRWGCSRTCAVPPPRWRGTGGWWSRTSMRTGCMPRRWNGIARRPPA